MKISLWINTEDEKQEILNLTKKIFGDVDITKASYFDWQYRDNPNGKAIILLARDDDSKNIIVGTNTIIPLKLIVDGKDYFWEEGKSVLFDDTYLHEVQNNTDEMRIALLLDIKRKIPGFLRYYDLFIFKLIQLILVLNNTFTQV